jgi:hypothetical protein
MAWSSARGAVAIKRFGVGRNGFIGPAVQPGCWWSPRTAQSEISPTPKRYGRSLRLPDSGESRGGIDLCDASRAEIANLDEMAKRWFAAVRDALDALRSISLVDVRDSIPPVVEIHGRKPIPLMQTIDRLVGCLTLHHNVNPQGDNRARENH